MKHAVTTLILIFLMFSNSTFGQTGDSLKLSIKTVESEELYDLYFLEGIHYFKLDLAGKGLKGKYYLLTSDEYFNKKLIKSSIIANSKEDGDKNLKDTISIRVISKKIHPDTVRFTFKLPRYRTSRHFSTTNRNDYSLLNITSSKEQLFSREKPINALVYSLPYIDPKHPEYSQYCKLSRDGTPPEDWGKKFGVQHYIVFKLILLE